MILDTAKRFFRDVFKGIAILAIAIGLPALAIVAFGAVNPKTGESYDFIGAHNTAIVNDRGLVLPRSEQRCGCPGVNEKRNWNRWPTRCHPRNANLPENNYRPFNSHKRTPTQYPFVHYPEGYPQRFLPNNRRTIPFPGWPLVQLNYDDSQAFSPWTEESRGIYLGGYVRLWGGYVPWSRHIEQGRAAYQGYPVLEPKGKGAYWQIHHILERNYGGTNHPQNLVPIYTRPNKDNPNGDITNNHNMFSQWWRNITVDSQCQSDTYVWSRIQNCRTRAVLWPMGNDSTN